MDNRNTDTFTPVEGIGIAETPITSTVRGETPASPHQTEGAPAQAAPQAEPAQAAPQAETGFVLVDTPTPSAPFETEAAPSAPFETDAAPSEPASSPKAAATYEPITESDIFGDSESDSGYTVFTDPYGMPMRPDGTSYYSEPASSPKVAHAAGSSYSGSSDSYSGNGSSYSGGYSGNNSGSGSYSGYASNSDSADSGNSYADSGYAGSSYGSSDSYSGTDYSGGGGNYGGGYSGGGYSDSGNYSNIRTVPAPMQLTRRAFVLIIIVAMLLTSALTVGGIALIGNQFAPKDTSATNYTLTESKETLDIASVVEKSKDSIVSITTEGLSTDMWAQNYVTKGAGSGVIVQSDGYIVTCYHVIDNANKIQVTTTDSKTYEAKVVGTDEDNDLAVIKIDAKNLHAVKYADSTKLQVGDRVVAIGNPLGQLSNTATTGIISALNRNLTIEGQKLNLLQTDASINPGNSGGALLDASGNLVGIVESKSAGSDVEGLGFAVPVNTVAKSVKEIIQTGSVSKSQDGKSDAKSSNKAAIGIIISELSDEQAMMYGYSRGGVLITSVTSDKARNAGLQQGDMILSADGDNVNSLQDLHDVLAKHKVGDKLKLEILRDGQTLHLTTTLVEATD